MAKSSLTDLFNMNESQFDHGANGDDVSKPYRKGSSSSTKRGIGGGLTEVTAERVVLNSSCPSPCGACKFLRRKCISGCIFAPYFGSDQGAAKFAAVHKVFGASNVSKLLLHIPTNRRHDAIVTISYEAQARLSDPVYGCVSTILALQQQVYYPVFYISTALVHFFFLANISVIFILFGKENYYKTFFFP